MKMGVETHRRVGQELPAALTFLPYGTPPVLGKGPIGRGSIERLFLVPVRGFS